MNNQLDKYIFSDMQGDSLLSDNMAIKEYQSLADEYCADANGGNRLRIYLILRNQSLVNALRCIPLEEKLAGNIELYTYTLEDIWSMEVLGIKLGQEPLLDRTPITYGSNQRVHLVLFGCGAQAVSLALHTALIAHFPNYCRDNWLRTRITWMSDSLDDFIHFKQQYKTLLGNSYRRNVIVKEEDVKVENFAPKYVNERRDFVDVEWEFVEGRSYNDIVSYKLNKWSQDEGQQLTVAFCYEDDNRNINEALNISIKKNRSIPVLLKVSDATSIELLKQSGCYNQLIPIGMREGVQPCMADFIRMGQYVNYAYCNMRSSTEEEKELGATEMTIATELPTEEELQELWNSSKLTTPKRWSNIYNAFTLGTKMRSLGIGMDEWERLFAISDRDVDIMAEVEHNRWCIEEMILGYSPTTLEEHNSIWADINKREQYKAEFKHDDLRNYSELGVDSSGLSVVRYDVGLTRTLPLIVYACHISKR